VPIDVSLFGNKVHRYREQRQLTFTEVADGTGIDVHRLEKFESGAATPSGDEVLILADFFQCDYRFFVSNEKLAAFEQTETLYRRFGDEFSKDDRKRVQEFLFLCECEAFLLSEVTRQVTPFKFSPSGSYYKGHGEQAADALRKFFSYASNVVPSNVYADFRKLGFHVFRRQLDNSNISGLTIRHPLAGTCILVNYSEDIYRQRFTAAHEAAHGILDSADDVVVSFKTAEKDDLVEVRANTFAARYLLPLALVDQIPATTWTEKEIIYWSSHFKVSTTALGISLKDAKRIDDITLKRLRSVRVPTHEKIDPELENLSERSLTRKADMLRRGLSTFYVGLCLEALNKGIITRGRTAEMMLAADEELVEILALFGMRLQPA
jgi:Zn-dependent peptidase ImmA (M78 family)/transcriptional regulator with XRE-family HTH domain